MAIRHATVALTAIIPLCTASADDIPSYIDDADALPERVDNVLRYRDLPPQSLSLHVENLQTGEVLLSFNRDEPRNPASVMKLVTTLVALDTLGPTYTWRTEVYANGETGGDTLEGDLLLKGYGDPFLVTERVWQMLRSLRRAGIRHIAGDLLLDDSWFDVSGYDPAAFDRRPLRAYNVAPNALMMNLKVTRFYFEPGADGSSVKVTTDPTLPNLELDNRLTLRKGSCRGYQRGVAVIPNETFDRLTFSGRFPDGCRIYAMDRTALGHNEYVYGLFRSVWEDLGGTLAGGWRRAVRAEDDEGEPLIVFESRPLAEMIAKVNKHSNNVMARQLLLTLGAEVYGAPGTEEKGRQAVVDWFDRNGLAYGSFELENGAGLSRTSRLTAVQLAAMLRFAYGRPYMPEYLASMSLSGLDGTMSRRFRRDDELAGRAHVKTGSLDDVSAIAGYVQARSGERYAVVVMQNHLGVHRGPGEEVQEALLRWVYEH